MPELRDRQPSLGLVVAQRTARGGVANAVVAFLIMTTVTVQIGNGDDKLAQSEWHAFVVEMQKLVVRYCSKLHFFGAPENWSQQQNVAFIFDVNEAAISALKGELRELRKHFGQESAAWTAGETEFI